MNYLSAQGLLFFVKATAKGAKRWTFCWQMLLRLLVILLFIPVLLMALSPDPLPWKFRLAALVLSLVFLPLGLINSLISLCHYWQTYHQKT